MHLDAPSTSREYPVNRCPMPAYSTSSQGRPARCMALGRLRPGMSVLARVDTASQAQP